MMKTLQVEKDKFVQYGPYHHSDRQQFLPHISDYRKVSIMTLSHHVLGALSYVIYMLLSQSTDYTTICARAEHISKNHIVHCSKIPQHLWERLPGNNRSIMIYPIDFALNSLPTSSKAKCPTWWRSLFMILWHTDKSMLPGSDFTQEPISGTL